MKNYLKLLRYFYAALTVSSFIVASPLPVFAEQPQLPTAALREMLGAKNESEKPYPYLSDDYMVASDPPGMKRAILEPKPLDTAPTKNSTERAAAVSGQNYTVVAPIYRDGGPDGGNETYLRLYNFELVSSTFTVNVVGYPSASIIGTATATVPFAASRQYSIGTILSAAGVPADLRGDSGLALYIKNPDDAIAYQNVIYNSNSRFFENVTLCGDNTLSDLNRVLINVHTSRIVGYPSYILFHNYSPFDVAYNAAVSDSTTGVGVGSVIYRFTAKANTTYRIPMSSIETQIGWQPSSTQFHANFIFGTQSTIDTYRAILGQLIYNESLQAFINMTQMCSILH